MRLAPPPSSRVFLLLIPLLPLITLAARAADDGAPRFTLAVPDAAPANPVAVLLAWLAESAPDYPATVAPEVAARVADEIRLRRPADLDRLGTTVAPAEFESLIWQVAAARLKGPAFVAQREALARRRVACVLRHSGQQDTAEGAAKVLFRLANESDAAYRRLLEGRMEDEELARVAADPGEERRRATAVPAVASPRVLTAAEIASEYARRNQSGAAAARFRAFDLEASLFAADGSSQELRLFKMRPNRFRLHVRPPSGEARVIGFDGEGYWHQEGPKVQGVKPEGLGTMRYLTEFLDPLIEPDGHSFRRLADGPVNGRNCFRVQVERRDGSGYVAVIDPENYHQVARENPDGSRVSYSDFREIGGLAMAFREDLTLAGGGTVRMEIRQLRPNPGLIATFFAPPVAQQLDLGPVEQLLAKKSP